MLGCLEMPSIKEISPLHLSQPTEISQDITRMQPHSWSNTTQMTPIPGPDKVLVKDPD